MQSHFLELNGSTLDKESAQMLNFIVSGADRMGRLIHDLLNFATFGQEAEIAEVDTHAVAKLAVRELEKAVEDSGAIIDIGSLPPIKANEEQLLRLFENLVGNAIKYRSKDAPEIHISASMVAGETIFSVSDNGIGIEPEYHQQIFHPFRRLHGASEYGG